MLLDQLPTIVLVDKATMPIASRRRKLIASAKGEWLISE